MTNSLLKLSVSTLVSLALPGCAAYHNLVNSFAPEKQRSELRQLVEAPLELSDEGSAFCKVPSETYMVMPEEGKVGTVVVTFLDGTEQVLEGDYSAMSVTGNKAETFEGNQEQVQALFGAAVGALPLAPYHAKLYFVLDKDELTHESTLHAQQVIDEIVKREIAEIIIVGHTDTAASFAYNNALSKRRADKVRQKLIDAGIASDIIQTRGAGEYELLLETPDNTPEPQNRRVEIDVR